MSSRGSSLLPWGAALAVLVALAACGEASDVPATPDAGTDAGLPPDSGTDAGTDAGTRPSDPYADEVVSFVPGEGAGFGQDLYPGVVLGPPSGMGPANGSLDVLSLGRAGKITLRFTDVGVVDGPGVDLLVFENAFALVGGTTYSETGVVEVSEDGTTWHAFPCASTDAAGG
ncbi:cell surface protein, partial [Pyxidicoccus sp. 3LG]